VPVSGRPPRSTASFGCYHAENWPSILGGNEKWPSPIAAAMIHAALGRPWPYQLPVDHRAKAAAARVHDPEDFLSR
jgi:hypothetical protein